MKTCGWMAACGALVLSGPSDNDTPLSATLTSPLTWETYSQNISHDSTSNKLSLSGRGVCEAGGEGIS